MRSSTPTDATRYRRADRARVLATGLLAAALVVAAPVQVSAAEPAGAAAASWQDVERVVAFADVHGAYTELVALLQSVGVVDAAERWSAGRAHVVSVGDLLDRGADSRKVMDLLMRLQEEAAAAGGRLHVTLGNHEAMNVLGDLRYVDPGEFAAYAAEEDPAERDAARAAFVLRNPGAEAQFDRLFPAGWFAHRRLLGPQGRYGRWLLAQPVAVRVNDDVYMHAGPSTLLHGRSLEALNRDYAAALAAYAAAEAGLAAASLLAPEDAFAGRVEAATGRLAARPPGPERDALAAAIERLRAADDDPLLGPPGPNWYRGAALCNECTETDVLEPFLRQTGARRVVVGHTVARHSTVVSRFDGRLVKLDAGMNRAVYRGRPAALVTDATGSRVAYALPTVAPAEIPAEPLYLSSQGLPEDVVAEVLERGTVEVVTACGPGVVEARVTHEGRSVGAVFEAATPEAVRRELAAYRLDRLLGLGLVPATVAREHSGQAGLLQARPANWASEQDRQNARTGARGGLACQTITAAPQAVPARRPLPADGRAPRLPAGGICDLPTQFRLAYAFDALIGNGGRTLDRFLYDTDSTTLLLTGHDAAFGSGAQLPKPLEAELAKIGPELQARLRRLDAAAVEAAIGELVGPRAVKPLLERRDRLLALAAGGAGR